MIIRKNTHAPIRVPSIIRSSNTLKYNVKFTESCKYSIGVDQDDINKLFGIGYFPGHRTVSVRFGWRYASGDNIQVFSYWYVNAVRYWDEIGSVRIGDDNVFVIIPDGSSHKLSVPSCGILSSVPVPSFCVGYLLRPYFGGNTKAPHDIEILIRK